MTKTDSIWISQFFDELKKLTLAYNRFKISREIEDLDIAEMISEEVNDTYEMSLDVLDYIELGRALLGK